MKRDLNEKVKDGTKSQFLINQELISSESCIRRCPFSSIRTGIEGSRIRRNNGPSKLRSDRFTIDIKSRRTYSL